MSRGHALVYIVLGALMVAGFIVLMLWLVT